MVEQDTLDQDTPLAKRALTRLQKLAQGNGLDEKDIVVFDAQESDVTLHAQMALQPLCEQESRSFVGAGSSPNAKKLPSPEALQAALAKHQKEFKENEEWLAVATQELLSHKAQGWGLEDAKVTLPDYSTTYTTTQYCPTCQGRGSLTCSHCQGRGTVTCMQCEGRGRELCYHCLGHGKDPQQPDQPCPICHGTRYAPCRACQSYGFLPCPTCNGTKHVPCDACQGQGSVTHEVRLTCGASTVFKIFYEDVPVGVKRGLDRIGVSHLHEGHATIEASVIPFDELDEEIREAIKRGAPTPVLSYKASLPHAAMKMRFGNKKAIVSAVGKRCAMVGVPAFLDIALQPWREQLAAAAQGKGSLKEALRARALKEILTLVVTGKGTVKEARRLYPFGFSSGSLASIVADTKRALKKTTETTRGLVALCGFLASVVFFNRYFMEGFEQRLTDTLPPWATLGVDLAFLVLTLGLNWILLTLASGVVFKRRFPEIPYTFKQPVGKTGLALFVALCGAFIGFLALAPIKPRWVFEGLLVFKQLTL